MLLYLLFRKELRSNAQMKGYLQFRHGFYIAMYYEQKSLVCASEAKVASVQNVQIIFYLLSINCYLSSIVKHVINSN